MIDAPREMIDYVRSVILSCGKLLREKRRRATVQMREKDDFRDIVTDHDVWVQDYLAGAILSAYPDHCLLSEEGRHARGTDRWEWIIDPIDGTTNYYQMGAWYAISVGLFLDGRPYYGFVFDVEQERLYEAGVPEADSSECTETGMKQSILHLSCKSMQFFRDRGSDPLLFTGQFQGLRYFGCASLEICLIAEEKAAVYIGTALKIWDFAAASLVLQKKGGHIVAVRTEKDNYFVAAFRSVQLYEQCFSYFPECIQKILAENGGKPFYVND